MSDAKSFKVELGGYDMRAESLPSGFEERGNDIICTKCNVTAL